MEGMLAHPKPVRKFFKEEYSDAKNVTYQNLTLEFPSSLIYQPYNGIRINRGFINFRLFGWEYKFNIHEFARILGFQYGPIAAAEVPYDRNMEEELATFWKAITSGGNTDPRAQFPTCIHNPTFQYFQMILAQSFFGRSETCEPVSAEKLFFL